eukprot:scaffold9535_cov96-Isochrysis_galbana.AAC.2
MGGMPRRMRATAREADQPSGVGCAGCRRRKKSPRMAAHRQREHPERDHGWEVEGRDAGTDAEGDAVRVGVDVGGHVGQRLAHHQRRHRARVLHHLQPAEDVSLGVVQRLAVLVRDEAGQVVGPLTDEGLQLEHHAGAVRHRRLRPLREGRARRLDGSLHLGCGRNRRMRQDILRGRAADRDRLGGHGRHQLVVDEERHRQRLGPQRARRRRRREATGAAGQHWTAGASGARMTKPAHAINNPASVIRACRRGGERESMQPRS